MKYKAIHKYIDYADLIEKSGYRTNKPRMNSLGKAFIEAVNKSQGRLAGKIKKQLDSYFSRLKEERKQRKEQNGKKQRHNKREVVSGNATSTQG